MHPQYSTVGPACAEARALGLSYEHISSDPPNQSDADAARYAARSIGMFAPYVEYAERGSFIRLRFETRRWESEREAADPSAYVVSTKKKKPANLRGKVAGFSAGSQRRLRVLTNSLPDTLPLPLFITLTYPGEFSGEPARWKRDLDRMLTLLHRTLEAPVMIWKLEPQERGAPHFHLAVYTSRFLKKRWLSKKWYRIVDSKDPRHLRAGTNIQRARTRRGSLSYIAKYIGKKIAPKEGWEHVGRYWGIRNRPAGMLKRIYMQQPAAYRIRRALWKFRASHNRRYKRTPWRGDAQGTSAYLSGDLAARLVAYGQIDVGPPPD